MDNFTKTYAIRGMKDIKYDLHVKGWVKVSGVSFDVDFDFNDESANNESYSIESQEPKFKHIVPIVEAINDKIKGQVSQKGVKSNVSYDVNIKGNVDFFGIFKGNVDFELKS
jgi:penicillin-binding protein-related factor A (putative recombinase)